MRHQIITRALGVIAVGCAVGFVLPDTVVAQEIGQIYVEARSETGELLVDLEPEEFSVIEDGNEGRIVSAQLGTAPMKIAILVDNGERTRENRGALNPIREGVVRFLEALPPQHIASLFTIGGQVKRYAEFTADRAELVDAAGSIFPDAGRGARMLDGIQETWRRRFDGDEPWPVFVMVLTDGSEASAFMNDSRYLDMVGMLREAGVIIHTVQLSTGSGSELTSRAINLAENTGGRYTSVAIATALPEVLEQLATDMSAHYDETSNRYRLVYERPDPPGERMSISITRPGARVRLFNHRRME